MTRLIPVTQIPGFNPIARDFASGSPSVRPFLPDCPGPSVLSAHTRLVLEKFTPRTPPPADPHLARLARGEEAAISTGQQTGVLTGPLLTVVKALAAIGAARDPAFFPLPVSPLFWCASEDHDLEEVTRIWLPFPDGAQDVGPDPVPLRGNRKPVGALPVASVIGAPPALLAAGTQDAEDFKSLALKGTFLEAFRSSLAWLLGEDRIPFVNAACLEDKKDVVPLACRLVLERRSVRKLLEERARDLEAAGYPLQVKTDPRSLPLFAITSSERRLLIEEGEGLLLKGESDQTPVGENEVIRRFESGEWLPSFSALTRPLAASILFPIAATVLGPAEIAYWAQMYPLFSWAGVVPPAIIPRPMVMLLDPLSRRLLEKTGLEPADVLRGVEQAVLRRGQSAGEPVLQDLDTILAEWPAHLGVLAPGILAMDANLKKPLETTAQNIRFALGKLREKVADAAGRSDQTFVANVKRLAGTLLPCGQLAERILNPLPFLQQFGREGLMRPLKAHVKWNEAGIKVIGL